MAMVDDDALCCVLCEVVRCCGGGAYPPFANVLGVDFSIIFHPKNTSFAHTKIPSKKPFCATHIPHFGTNLPHQNKEYVRCDSRSMWHLVHFERRGIRGKYSISMEFQNFHGGVREIIHPLFHPPKCSVPTVALRDSDDDGQMTRSHLSHRRVFFQFHR